MAIATNQIYACNLPNNLSFFLKTPTFLAINYLEDCCGHALLYMYILSIISMSTTSANKLSIHIHVVFCKNKHD